MNAELIHRLHFAFTVTFHYLFPQLTMGLALIAISIALFLLWAVPAGRPLAWVVSSCVLLSGLFGLFEAAKGWCAMKAIGFKMPW